MSKLLPGKLEWGLWGKIFTDATLWAPVVQRVWERSPTLIMSTGVDRPRRITSGFPGTCAVFVVDDLAVVKFFPPFAHEDYRRERYVLERLINCQIALPHLLSAGVLNDRIDWPYLVTRFEKGQAWRDIRIALPQAQQLATAAELGQTIRAVHTWSMDAGAGWPNPSNWSDLVMTRTHEAPTELAQLTNLTDAVVREALELLQSTDWFANAPCLVHADLTEDHILVEKTDDSWRLSSVIDWADTEVADPTYDWVALWFSFCGLDADLFRAFLAAYDAAICIDSAFMERLVAFSVLHRFGPRIIAELVPQDRQQAIVTLGELAQELFPGLA